MDGAAPVSGNVERVVDDFLTPNAYIPNSGTDGPPMSGNLTSYIQNLYDNPAANGFTPGTSYLVLRLNPTPTPSRRPVPSDIHGVQRDDCQRRGRCGGEPADRYPEHRGRAGACRRRGGFPWRSSHSFAAGVSRNLTSRRYALAYIMLRMAVQYVMNR